MATHATPRTVRILRTVRTSRTVLSEVVAELHFNAEGQLHRADGPASVYTTYTTEESGARTRTTITTRESWYDGGQLHNEEGPARTIQVKSEEIDTDRRRGKDTYKTRETSDTQEWFIRGRRHQEAGPAVAHTRSESSTFRSGMGYDKIQTTRKGGQYSYYVNGKLHRADAPARVAHEIVHTKVYSNKPSAGAPHTFNPEARFVVKHEHYRDGLPHPQYPTETSLVVHHNYETYDLNISSTDCEEYKGFYKYNIAPYDTILETESLECYRESMPDDDGYKTPFGNFELTQKWLDEGGRLHREGSDPAQVYYSVNGIWMLGDPRTYTITKQHYTHGQMQRQDGNTHVMEHRTFSTPCGGMTHIGHTFTTGADRYVVTSINIRRNDESIARVYEKRGNTLHNLLFGPASREYTDLPSALVDKLIARTHDPQEFIALCEQHAKDYTHENYVFGMKCEEFDRIVMGRSMDEQVRNWVARRAVRRWRLRCGQIQPPEPFTGIKSMPYKHGKLYMNFRAGRLDNTDQIPHAGWSACAYVYPYVDDAEAYEQWNYENGSIRSVVKLEPSGDGSICSIANINQRDWWGKRHGCTLVGGSEVVMRFPHRYTKSKKRYYIHGAEVTEEQYKYWEDRWGDGRNHLFGLWPTMNKDRLLATLLRPFNSPNTRHGRTKLWRLYLDTLPEGADQLTFEEFIAATSA